MMRADRLSILLCVTATGILATGRSGVGVWLTGRVNGQSNGVLFLVACVAAWAALFVGLILRACTRRGIDIKRRRTIVVLIALALAPWFLVTGPQSGITVYARGFGRWAVANTDVRAIRQWQARLQSGGTIMPAPHWWPTVEREALFGVPVPRAQYVPPVGQLGADEVRVLSETESVIFAWQGGAFGWSRLLLVGPPGLAPPDEIKKDYVVWFAPREGVLVGVVTRN